MTSTVRPRLNIFLLVPIRHSNLCREDFGARPECSQGKHGTGRQSVEFRDIRGTLPQPGPTPGPDTFAELARSVRASVPILLIAARSQTSIQRSAWFLFCL